MTAGEDWPRRALGKSPGQSTIFSNILTVDRFTRNLKLQGSCACEMKNLPRAAREGYGALGCDAVEFAITVEVHAAVQILQAGYAGITREAVGDQATIDVLVIQCA